jgi:cation transporter-like permease
MAHSGAHHGGMNIHDQKQTFHGFLVASLWLGTQIIMVVALATLAFAIGAGWWAGLAAFVAIGVAVGLLFKMSGAWWATLIAQTVLLGLGGMIIPAISGMMG